MVKEIQPLPFVNKLPRGLRKPVYAAVTLAALAAAAACGGGKEVVSSTVAPTAPNTPTPEATFRPQPSPEATAGKPTPSATPKLETPVPTATPTERPTLSPTPEVKVPKGLVESAPAQVKEFYSRVNTIAPKFQHPDAVANFKKSLEDANKVDNPNPRVKEVLIFDNYTSAFGGLVGAYYATGNSEILQLAKDVKAFIAATYPVLYQQDLKDSPQVWEIREISR